MLKQATSSTADYGWTEGPPGTTASSIATGHPSHRIGRFELVTPDVQNRIARAFEMAMMSGREVDWERFVERVSELAENATETEVFGMLPLVARAVNSNYRPAAALARALGAYAENERWGDLAEIALAALLTHKSPEVRLQVLEVAQDANKTIARRLAMLVRVDPHETVRRIGEAIETGR